MRKSSDPGTKLSNSIYIPERIRQKLEELAVDTGFHRKRQITKSAFVQFLIEEFGEQAKCQLIADSLRQDKK
ncbi:hypothetical protein JRK10_004898 [Salmonella enterica]|nr:hypothetical protein [Salmonella enterica]